MDKETVILDFQGRCYEGYYKLHGEDFISDAIAEAIPYLKDSMLLGPDTDYAVLARNLVTKAWQQGYSCGYGDIYSELQDLLEMFK